MIQMISKRRITVFASLGLFSILGALILSVWSGHRYSQTSEWRNHSEEVLTQLTELRVLMEQAETAQRGYMLTKQEDFLGPYTESKAQIETALKRIRASISDNLSQTQRFELLTSSVLRKMENLEKTLVLAKSGQHQAALQAIQRGEGKRLMDQVRSQFYELQAAESALLRERTLKAQQEFERASTTVMLSLFAAFVLLLVATLLLRNEVRSRTETARNLAKAEAKAQEASELKSRFLANMSHEIRTPLNGIIGMTRILSDGSLTEEQREQLQIVRDSSNTLLSLINQLLDLSKIESGKLELERIHYQLRSLVQGSVSIVQGQAQEKGLSVDLAIAEDIPDLLVGDPLRLRQILMNLLNNAIKFSSRGTIRLHFHVQKVQDSRIHLQIEVSDQGIGMAPETLSKLFQSFTQADETISRRFGGTGLGLAITKQLVEMMGGTISVESELGKGTSFRLQLSQEIGQETEVSLDSSGPEQLRLSARVLVAEDNLTNQKVFAAMLKKLGCEFTIVGDGEAAYEKLQHGDFDLVLMDAQMPGWDGEKTTREIRAEGSKVRHRQIPILAVTASAIKGDIERCLNAGMNDFISKPISFADLALKMSKWIHNETPRLDLMALEKLKDLDDDGLLLREMLTVFCKLSPGSLLKLRQAVQAQEWEEMRREAHSFKSSCANVGAGRLRDLVQRIEALHGDELKDQAENLIEAAENEYRDFMKELFRYGAA